MYNVMDGNTGAHLGGFTSWADAYNFVESLADGDYTPYQIANDRGHVLVEWVYKDWRYDLNAVRYSNSKGDHVTAWGEGYALHTKAHGYVALFEIMGKDILDVLEQAEGLLARIEGEAPEYLSVADAATTMGVTKARVYQLIHNGKLHHARLGSVYLVDKQAAERVK